MKHTDDIRSLALIGARVRLAELEEAVKDTKATIKALQGVPKSATKRKQYSDEFKADVIANAKSTSVSKAAAKYKVKAHQIYKWLKK